MMCLKQKRPSALVLRAQAAIKYIAPLTPQSGLKAPPNSNPDPHLSWLGLGAERQAEKGLRLSERSERQCGVHA